MGSRAQLKVTDGSGDAPVFLYTHWGSYNLHETLAAGLKRGEGRWTDGEYLARILFCELVRDDIDGETGFGISTSEHSDLDFPAVEVNVGDKTVTWSDGHGGLKSKSFGAFVSEPESFE